MATKSELENKISKLKKVKFNINTMLPKLSSSITNAKNVSNITKSYYLVNDDVTPVVARTNKLIINIQSTYDTLKNKVIPAINSEIAWCEAEIKKIEEEEEKEETTVSS